MLIKKAIAFFFFYLISPNKLLQNMLRCASLKKKLSSVRQLAGLENREQAESLHVSLQPRAFDLSEFTGNRRERLVAVHNSYGGNEPYSSFKLVRVGAPRTSSKKQQRVYFVSNAWHFVANRTFLWTAFGYHCSFW